MRYVQIDAYSVSVRLLKNLSFTINGIPTSAPFSSGGIKLYNVGIYLVYATDFGLTIYWDGKLKYDLSLCDAYGGNVCGLCGNGDSKSLKFKYLYILRSNYFC